MMKHIVLFVTALAFALAVTATTAVQAQQHANYSGTWKLAKQARVACKIAFPQEHP